MKNLTILNSIFITALAIGLTAHADDLSPFTNEASWQTVSLQVENYTGSVSAVLTDRQTARIENLPERMTTNAQITMPLPGHSVSTWNHVCANPTAVQTENMLQESFTLQLHVNPAVALSGVNVNGRHVPVENVPQLKSMGAKVALLDGALSDPGNVDFFQSQILEQYQDQRDVVAKTGVLTLKFTGDNELACDLITGKAWLGLVPTYTFQTARLIHSPLLSGDQLQQIYQCAKQRNVPGASEAMNGSTFGTCGLQINPQAFANLGKIDFQKIFNLLYGTDGVTFNSGIEKDFASAASSLDDLSAALTTQSTIISETIQPQGIL